MDSVKDNPILKREIIMDHYQNPRNYNLVDDNNYRQIHMYLDSCFDDIYLQVLINHDIIEDVRFDGVACAIATASTSIMTEIVKGCSIRQADKSFKTILICLIKRIMMKNFKKKLLYLIRLRQANRIKCATIGWKGLKS